MENFNVLKREQKPSWLLAYINFLLGEANKYKNSSFVLYAALEVRNTLELLEYSLIFMSLSEEERENTHSSAIEKGQVDKMRNKYKTLKFKHLTFFKTIMELSPSLPLLADGVLKMQEIDKYMNEISGSIHIYTLIDADLDYDSNFIEGTYNKINEIITFLIQNFVKEVDGEKQFTYGNLVLESLPPDMKQIYVDWKNNPNQTPEAIEELKRKIQASSFVDEWTEK